MEASNYIQSPICSILRLVLEDLISFQEYYKPLTSHRIADKEILDQLR